ncbi:MAG: Uma2 family endonuclease [Actinomycetota bacterium]|nr:Uma2 family endonuclease [Actinomycetota bacterium]
MAITVPAHVPVHPLTVEDYHRMIEAGVLGEDDRVELLEGVLVEVSPVGPEHAQAVARLNVHFAAAMVAGTAIARVQCPITRRDDRSEPEPDLLVIEAEPVAGHPVTALLAIEVAVTSHAVDRLQKARIYARAGIPEYWLVDVPGQAIEVRTEPTPDGYVVTRTVRAGDELTAVAVPDTAGLDVRALFAAPVR